MPGWYYQHMKKALKIALLAVPIALLWYSRTALVPAVDAKNLLIRGLVALAGVLVAALVLTDKGFRTELSSKLTVFWRHPIGKALAACFGVFTISTVLAYSPFTAFFGTATRGEGFVGLFFFYLLALLSVLVFDKKDWSQYWRLTALAGGIVFLKELFLFIGGAYRPGAYMDNPIFLAGYFLWVIYAGLMLAVEGRETRNKTLTGFGWATVGISVIGILITQSRGVMLGMVVGAVVALAYIAVKKNSSSSAGQWIGRRTAAIILACLLAFGGLFAATRHAPLWSHVPGFSRLAEFSVKDPTTLSRLENARLTLRAVRPTASNIKNTLVGWGWDNYVFAWQTHYDPTLYLYDKAIFDRAHNKLLDVLVMNGVLGLVAYLALWAGIVWAGISIGKRSQAAGVALLFFATASFVQNLFVFDTIISYVPFFTLVAYMAFETRNNYEQKH